MHLLSQTQLGKRIGVSRQSISKAVKQNKLDFYIDQDGNTTGKIDADSPKTNAYINASSPQRQNKILEAHTNPVQIIQPSEIETVPQQSSKEITNDIEKYAKARAEKEKQAAKNLKLKNSHLEGTLVEKEVILTGALMYFDTLHQNLDRFFGTVLDNLAPKILAAGDCTPSIAQEAIDEGKRILHEGKLNFLSRVQDIITDIGGKK